MLDRIFGNTYDNKEEGRINNPIDDIIFKLKELWQSKELFEKKCIQFENENAVLRKRIKEHQKIVDEKSLEIEKLNRLLQASNMNLDKARRESEMIIDRYQLELDKLRNENKELNMRMNESIYKPKQVAWFESTKESQKDKIISSLKKELEETKSALKTEKQDANRTLVEQLIIYAEGEDKKVAREIKIALNTKMANGYIASDVLTQEWKQRLEDLGRDKPMRGSAMNFNKPVGTVVAHADHVTLQYKEDE